MPDLSITAYDEAFDRERFGTHGAIGMQARGRDAYFGAETEFAAITEAR